MELGLEEVQASVEGVTSEEGEAPWMRSSDDVTAEEVTPAVEVVRVQAMKPRSPKQVQANNTPIW